ncbi:cell division protein ZipA [Salinisphaera sp.]|uniref:cell division protein ZipA n=1 Tax=Salinisphaera sp. TaxID=1914330 RepID=UPI002D78D911|nr:cell division protein ZipA [Salinisphaera sp.]HET7313622.1 cell division protein ZipA [Salinisphaera sp.]
MQWLLLVLVVVIVAGVYWYIRRQGGGDPWHGMDEPVDGGDSTSAGGDSYVVGVRTINKETPADRKAAAEAARVRAGANEPPDRTRAPRQPTAVRRRSAADGAQAESAASGGTAVRSSEAEPPRGLQDDETGRFEAESVGTTMPDETPGEPQEVEPAATERVEMTAAAQTEHSQLFMLYVTAREGQVFDGPAIHEALARADLKFGLNDLYHRVTEVHGVTESVFCVANMLKPGTLDPIDQDHLSTPGLTLFLLVPAPIEGKPAMRDMMETANRLATDLGGIVLDDNRALLKAQTAQYMLDQIADIDRRAQLGRRR